MSIEDIKNNMIPDEIKYICMKCEENIHCQGKGCAYRSLGNEYCDYVLQATKLYLEKDKEIERLNELVKGLREERDYLFNKTTTESNYEIERLNNIINELENYCEEKIIEYNEEIKIIDNTMDKMNLLGARSSFNNILDKLQELKGDSSNE